MSRPCLILQLYVLLELLSAESRLLLRMNGLQTLVPYQKWLNEFIHNTCRLNTKLRRKYSNENMKPTASVLQEYRFLYKSLSLTLNEDIPRSHKSSVSHGIIRPIRSRLPTQSLAAIKLKYAPHPTFASPLTSCRDWTFFTSVKFTTLTKGHSFRPANIRPQKSCLAICTACSKFAPWNPANTRLNRRVLRAAPIVWSSRNFMMVFEMESLGSRVCVFSLWPRFFSSFSEATLRAEEVGTRYVEGKLCSRNVCLGWVC